MLVKVARGVLQRCVETTLKLHQVNGFFVFFVGSNGWRPSSEAKSGFKRGEVVGVGNMKRFNICKF